MSVFPGGSGQFWRDELSEALIGGIAGGLIGGTVGGITIPKGYNILIGKPHRNPISSVYSLKSSEPLKNELS